MRIEFKDIIHHHIGCHILNVDDNLIWKLKAVRLGLNGFTTFDVTKKSDLGGTWSIKDFEYRTKYVCPYKPILYPLSAMTDEQYRESEFKTHPKEWTSTPMIEIYYRPKSFLFLLRNHFNVFGLEPDLFINPATLPQDPYK